MHYPLLWKFRVLRGINGNGRAENRRMLDAWGRAEGGTAANNPLNTTEPWPGATQYNSAGVKNYASQTDGIRATAVTLLNGHYPGIVRDLRAKGETAGDAATMVRRNRAEISVWGTSPDLILKILGV